MKRKMARYHQMTSQRRNALAAVSPCLMSQVAIFFDHNMPLGPGNDPGDDLFETETQRDQQVPACSSNLVMNSLLSVLSLSLVQGFSSCNLWPHLGTWNYSVVVCFSVPRHQQQGFNNQIMDLIPYLTFWTAPTDSNPFALYTLYFPFRIGPQDLSESSFFPFRLAFWGIPYIPLWDTPPALRISNATCTTVRATNSPFAPPCDLHRKQGHTTQQHMHRTDPALHRFDALKSSCAHKIHNFKLGFRKTGDFGVQPRCCHRFVSSKLQRMSSLAIHGIAPGHFAPGPKNSQESQRRSCAGPSRSNTQSSEVGQGRPPSRRYCRTPGSSIKLHRAWLWVCGSKAKLHHCSLFWWN